MLGAAILLSVAKSAASGANYAAKKATISISIKPMFDQTDYNFSPLTYVCISVVGFKFPHRKKQVQL